MEVTKDMIGEWFKGTPDLKEMIEETEKIYEECMGRAMNFYEAFFRKSIIIGKK